jgi:hypothetical protein
MRILFFTLIAVIGVDAHAADQRLPVASEKKLLREATAEKINISRANFTFLPLPRNWLKGTYAYSFGIWPKNDRSKFDCAEAIVEMKGGRILKVEEISFDDAQSCEGARPK